MATAATIKFTLHYRSGWRTAFAHHRTAPAGPWTALPGTRLARAGGAPTSPTRPGGAAGLCGPAARTLGPDWHRLDVEVERDAGGGGGGGVGGGGGGGDPAPATGLELVLTDGNGAWDHPSRACRPDLTAGGAEHYFLPASGGGRGEYVLTSGCLTPVVGVAAAAAAAAGVPPAASAGAGAPGATASAGVGGGSPTANGSGGRAPGDGGDGVTTPTLLVTDLDGTLLGDAAATATFTAAWRTVHAPAGGVLVYNTGRSVCSVKTLLASAGPGALETPAAVICAVGSEVYWYHPALAAAAGGGKDLPVRDTAWEDTLSVDGWDRAAVMAVAQSVIVDTGLGHWRPAFEQTAHKIVLGVNATAVKAVMAAVEAQLGARGIGAQLICCGVGDWRYLDVASTAAGKWAAMAHVRRRLGAVGVGDFAPAQTLVAGDSGNDIAMFAGGDERGVVVGNAQAELLDWLAAERAATGGAVDGRVVHADGKCAAGILEGLRRLRMV